MSSGLALEAEGGRWKRYPAYRDSGVEWLEEIPEGWSSPSVKHHYTIQLGKMLQNKPDSDEDILVPYAKALYVLWGNVVTDDLPKMWANPSDIQQYGIEGGDLLVCEGGEVGRAGVVTSPPEQCIIQNALHRVRAKKSSDVYFLKYVLHAVSSSTWFDVLCNKATIAHFTREKFADLRIPVPPLPEQHAIAAFLDRETGRIDALVAKKERQIELLQEKRAALISHAVTKGLDPDVPMKDSGVEWLGDVPEGWKVEIVKWFTAMHKQGYYTEQAYIDEGVKLARITDIDDSGNVYFENMPFVAISPKDESSFKLKEGDFLFARSGTIGRFGVVKYPERSVFASYLILFRFKSVEKEFLRYSFGSHFFKESLLSALHGGANQNVHAENIKEQSIAIPPLPEQHAIATFLDRETGHIDILTTKVHESISKLREYRTALISAAVTGKIDVRGEET